MITGCFRVTFGIFLSDWLNCRLPSMSYTSLLQTQSQSYIIQGWKCGDFVPAGKAWEESVSESTLMIFTLSFLSECVSAFQGNLIPWNLSATLSIFTPSQSKNKKRFTWWFDFFGTLNHATFISPTVSPEISYFIWETSIFTCHYTLLIDNYLFLLFFSYLYKIIFMLNNYYTSI